MLYFIYIAIIRSTDNILNLIIIININQGSIIIGKKWQSQKSISIMLIYGKIWKKSSTHKIIIPLKKIYIEI